MADSECHRMERGLYPERRELPDAYHDVERCTTICERQKERQEPDSRGRSRGYSGIFPKQLKTIDE